MQSLHCTHSSQLQLVGSLLQLVASYQSKLLEQFEKASCESKLSLPSSQSKLSDKAFRASCQRKLSQQIVRSSCQRKLSEHAVEASCHCSCKVIFVSHRNKYGFNILCDVELTLHTQQLALASCNLRKQVVKASSACQAVRSSYQAVR